MAVSLWAGTAHAAYDPVRAGLVELLSKQAKKTVEAQVKAQGLMTFGHIWLNEEVSLATDFQEQFSKYINMYRNTITQVAEVYGIFYEFKHTAKYIGDLENVLASSPENALALAFSAKRNKVYAKVVQNGISVLQDISMVCFQRTKMTEAEREMRLASVRPKLREFNNQLCALALAMRYTTFMDLWLEISGQAATYTPANRRTIVQRAHDEWMRNARSVR